MKKISIKIFLGFLFIAMVFAIWFSQNWYKIPKYIGDWKNPTGKNVTINWEKGPETRVSSKPNVIVILVDDLGFNQISAYGGGMSNGNFKTPNIDQLAKDGVLCTNGYSSSAICSPSRASLLTGKFPTRFGFEFTPTTSSFMKGIKA
jgi:Arylsulfatase A and related enzymes